MAVYVYVQIKSNVVDQIYSAFSISDVDKANSFDKTKMQSKANKYSIRASSFPWYPTIFEHSKIASKVLNPVK